MKSFVPTFVYLFVCEPILYMIILIRYLANSTPTRSELTHAVCRLAIDQVNTQSRKGVSFQFFSQFFG